MIRKANFGNLIVIGFVFALIAGMSIEAEGQRRSRSKRKRATAKKSSTLVADRRKGAEDVAIQIKNVTKFVFVLGGVASGIEEIDKEVKAGKASKELAAKNAGFKSDIMRSIRALRSGLVKLEISFRTNPALKPYLKHIQGIIGATAEAEDLAIDGQFTNSGKQLLSVVETLTDVLVEMP